MGFDVVGFCETAPGTGTPNIAVALGENFYTVVNGDWILVKNPLLLAAKYVAASTPAQLQIDMPELKPWYSMIKAGLAADVDDGVSLSLLHGRPLPLWDTIAGKGFKAGGQLRVMSRNATDDATIVGLWMGTERITQAMLDAVSPTQTLRGVSTTDQVVNTWTTLTTTWDNVLAEGRYAVVGMRAGAYKASGPSNGLARLIFKSGPSAGHRPGVPMALAEAAAIEYMSVYEEASFPWQWPLFGQTINTFLHTEIPNVEVLAASANTDHLVELVLQKVG